MMNRPPVIIFISGAGGGMPDFDVFRDGADDSTRFETIEYPGWKSCLADGFTAEGLLTDIVDEIAIRVPQGPVRIIGLSIGGHFGYAAALRLKSMGRDIAGFCAIDTFMVVSTKPLAGWQRRALAEGLELIRRRRFREFMRFFQSRLWRILIRLSGGRLNDHFQRLCSSGGSRYRDVFDPLFEEELRARLLIEAAAPWIAMLDREPVPLFAPSVLLRTRRLTVHDDSAWLRRCPGIKIYELPGRHDTLFDNKNSLREVFLTATSGWRMGTEGTSRT
jgi:thioesterase domain-containing protein